MTTVLLWKEVREQRTILLALAVLILAVLVGIPLAFPTERVARENEMTALQLLAMAFAWTYGLICGGMLLAGEREGGTEAFLDTLPVPRLTLWFGKFRVGLILLAGMVVFLFAILLGTGHGPTNLLPLTLLLLVYSSLLGFGWALLFSARQGNVTVAISLAILAQLLVIPPLQLLFVILFLLPSAWFGVDLQRVGFASALLIAPLLPLPLSVRSYNRLDLDRSPRVLALRWLPESASLAPWKSALWLSWAQMRRFALILVGCSFLIGSALASIGAFVWPFLALGIGVTCGASAFQDEQKGPSRFLGDQRFPLLVLWLTRLGLRFGVGLVSLFFLGCPVALRFFVDLSNHPLEGPANVEVLARLFHSRAIGPNIPLGLFLFAPFLYGFAGGHLAGLLFRKSIVALVVGFGGSMLALGIWVPSFMLGGLHTWQVLTVPILLLGGCAGLLYPWANQQLNSARAILRLGTCLALGAGLTALGLWYRVLEIPNVPEPANLDAYLAGLPDTEHNGAGRAVRAALADIDVLQKKWHTDRFSQRREARESYVALAQEFVLKGKLPNEKEDTDFLPWIEGVFAQGTPDQPAWWQRLDQAVGKPVGMVEDPRRRGWGQAGGHGSPEIASTLLVTHGLVRQRKGDPAAFVEDLGRALTLAENFANGGGLFEGLQSSSIEQSQLRALDFWLEGLRGRPDLLKRVARILVHHRTWLVQQAGTSRLAEFVLHHNNWDRLEDWLSQWIQSKTTFEPALLALVLRLPWEHERQVRLQHELFAASVNRSEEQMREYRLNRQQQYFLGPFWLDQLAGLEKGFPSRLSNFDAACLKVAVRLYQLDKGHLPKSLRDLVPGYLQQIPLDPHDNQSFRYRVSQGEQITLEDGSFLDVAPGQGVLWSVGEDRVDEGGVRKARPRVNQPREAGNGDMIYLVPLLPK